MPENKGQITPQVNSKNLGYQITKTFKTSLLLKLLRKNFPDGTPDRTLPDEVVKEFLELFSPL